MYEKLPQNHSCHNWNCSVSVMPYADRESKPQLEPCILILFANYFVIILNQYARQCQNGGSKEGRDMDRECRRASQGVRLNMNVLLYVRWMDGWNSIALSLCCC